MGDMDKIVPLAKKKRQHYRSLSSNNASHFYCNLCKVDINIWHGGLKNIT